MQSEWYKKLRESGFEDIENTDTGLLKRYTIPRTKRTGRATNAVGENNGGKISNERYEREETRRIYNTRYYALCQSIQHTQAFLQMSKNYPHHRTIWEMHCEGITYAKIAKALDMHYQGIKWVINKYRPLVKEANDKPDDEPDSDT